MNNMLIRQNDGMLVTKGISSISNVMLSFIEN